MQSMDQPTSWTGVTLMDCLAPATFRSAPGMLMLAAGGWPGSSCGRIFGPVEYTPSTPRSSPPEPPGAGASACGGGCWMVATGPFWIGRALLLFGPGHRVFVSAAAPCAVVL